LQEHAGFVFRDAGADRSRRVMRGDGVDAVIEFVIGGFVLGAVFYLLSDGDPLFLAMSCVMPIAGVLLAFLPVRHTTGETRHIRRTEKAYLMRANKDIHGGISKGYPMVVGYDVYQRGLATGDYDDEGEATEVEAGGYLYTGLGYGEIYVPSGEIPLEESQYKDERLNG
jgi:hypothetical protein